MADPAQVAAAADSKDPTVGLEAVRSLGSSWSARAKKVLDVSLRESLALQQRMSPTGTSPSACPAAGDGLAMEVLTALGADPRAVRWDVQAALPA